MMMVDPEDPKPTTDSPEVKPTREVSKHSLRELRFHGAEIFTLVCPAVLGTISVISIPLGAGWDEESHAIRVWEMAFLNFIPNTVSRAERPIPRVFWDLSYRQHEIVRPIRLIEFWREYGHLKVDGLDYTYDPTRTRSVFSPLLLAPHSLAFRNPGLRANWSALAVFYAARLLGLASYALLGWISVRLVPFGKWTLAVVVLLPTALFQAASISADPVSNGLGFLFIAGILWVDSRDRLGLKLVGVLLALIALLFNAKVSLLILALLPFLLLGRSRFRPRFGYILLHAGTIALFAFEVVGWNLIGLEGLGRAGIDPVKQGLFVLGHPFQFAAILVRDLWVHLPFYITQSVAEFGYEYWSVPAGTRLVVLSAIAAAVWLDSGSRVPSKRQRIALQVVFLMGALATFLALYTADNPVGSPTIGSVQGRYFIGLVPLLLLALSGVVSGPQYPQITRKSLVFALSVAYLMYLGGLWLSYHVNCGPAYYELGCCYQPVYRNWAPYLRFSDPLEFELRQEFTADCGPVENVRVWVEPNPSAASTHVRLSLIDQVSGDVMASSQANVNDAKEDQWM